MVMFVWLEDTQTMRDVWKCVSMDTGDTSVMIDGIPQALWLCASSCSEKILVRESILICHCCLCPRSSLAVFLSAVSMFFPCTYFPGAAPFSSYVFRDGSGKIMLYNIACTGSPSRLVDCSYSLVQGSRSGGCGLSEDAGIRCYGMF